jgi:hypothetical protein
LPEKRKNKFPDIPFQVTMYFAKQKKKTISSLVIMLLFFRNISSIATFLVAIRGRWLVQITTFQFAITKKVNKLEKMFVYKVSK